MESDLLARLIDAEQLYQNAPCGYFSLSADGKIIKINLTLLNWLGYDEKELLGQKFASLLAKGGQMHFEMFFWPVASISKAVKEFSYEILRKDGSLIAVLLNASALLDEHGKLQAINAVLTNTTERKNYEKEILHSKRVAESEKKRLQFMADLVPEIIWTTTAKGNIDYVNARFCQYFNCNGEDTRSSFVLSKVHKDDLRELLKVWYRSIETGEHLQKEIRLLNREGIYEWHLLKSALFLDEEGNMTNWFGSCANINDHINALKKKDEFISIASHELKTPITSLKAVLQLLDRLKNDPSNKMVPGLIEKANRNVDKVNALVEDLLNASQMNQGQLHLNKSMFNLAGLISDCVHHVRIDQRYEIIIEGDITLQVFADEGRIEQVIANFITNAIKYAPDSKQIFINLKDAEGTILVEVVDKGPGIAKEKIPHLFDRYYQIENKGSKYSGLGLGLFICAEIIKRHDGEIGARSTPGEGSTFWFSLPNS
jgi:two-component system CheB/CheR fusion protein